jgi:hypothetical protein
MSRFARWFHRGARSAAAGRPARGFRPRLEALEQRCLLSADAVLQWNAVMLQAEANDYNLPTPPDQPGPVLAARAFAIVSAVSYDAYNSTEHVGDPYLVKAPGAGNADANAAVDQAAHDTLVALFPSQKPYFDAELSQTLAQIPDGKSKDRGQAVGAWVAQQTLQARQNDGAANIQSPAYVPSGLPGFHAADPLHPDQGYYAPGAENVTPFAVRSVDQFAPPRLDDGTPQGRAAFLQSQQYTDAYNEVMALGGDGITTPTTRTPEQTVIGMFWGYDGRPSLGTPPREYNQIARIVAVQEGNTEAQNARLFALLNLSMADAGLSAWTGKYDNDFWRPILGIRNGNADGNPATVGDPNWTPLGAQVSNPRPGETNFTPPFPSYTSGHATFGAAAFETLTRFYGRDDISFSVTSDEFNGVTRGADGQVRPVVTRTFDSFSQAEFENAQSRIYLGIHWSFDRDQGLRTGNEVADYVFDHYLQPKHGQGGGGGDRPDAPAATGTSAPGATPAAPGDHSAAGQPLSPVAVAPAETGATPDPTTPGPRPAGAVFADAHPELGSAVTGSTVTAANPVTVAASTPPERGYSLSTVLVQLPGAVRHRRDPWAPEAPPAGE